ncbi:hypothetical protein SDRG_08505 [Saprolegnia diclina VS20]|uniref:FYVE-type domain-containing protein n=1 Tax=Saprolegnia diclina (strain VS20) TaxID=1156394 RepID=T0RTX1_SAPDV|nr:hypothetical protein SDRG_08505 [Saprolegnia diclina VS20]EQC33822.1 hypothetical protein SDRG_08505 [Saprolegnia diclina VS20]|eukprot:XP_008612617.1 hypothetical protein SDRG_08505 [Saprolegnia diclina VS20]
MPTKKRFPLPDDFFHAPPLSEADADAYRARADVNLTNLIASATSPMKLQTWTPIGRTSGVNLFQMHSSALPANASYVPYRAVARISATIDEVAALHAFETRAKCFEYMRCYASDILDIIPLYSLRDRSPDAPHRQTYVKWAAVQSPLSVISNRDYLYLEGQNTFTMASGRRGWAYCQSSIELPACCAPLRQFDLVRGSLEHTGCVFLETATPGVLDVVYHIASDFKGSIPHFAMHLAVRRRARKITMVDDYVHQQRLRHTVLLESLSMTSLPVTTRPKHCMLCSSSFRFRRPKTCQPCGKVVCSSCSRKWTMPTDASAPMRVCHVCSKTVRSSLPPASMPGLRDTESMSDNSLDGENDAWSTEPPPVTGSGGVDMAYLQVYESAPRRPKPPRKSSLDLPVRPSMLRPRNYSEDVDYSTDASFLYDMDGLVDPMITLRVHNR